ncbi:HMG-Y-related protein A [Linum grandiflorum]
MAAEEVDRYPQMILSAISSLDEKEGSNKSTISSYIEANYSDIPEAHQILLSHHLNRMKDSGELVFSKNNYSIPGPDGPPPKRGRGRPPKPKGPPAPASASLAPTPSSIAPAAVSTRGRGRPPKDPNAPPKPSKPSKPASTGRPRGRPRKIARVADDDDDDDDVAEADDPPPPAMSAGTGRPRGRPPKAKPTDAATVAAEVSV